MTALLSQPSGCILGYVLYSYPFSHQACAPYTNADKHRINMSVKHKKVKPKTLAQAAASREHFIKSIADAIPGMVAYWDSHLLCRFANKRYLEWFGRLPEELIDIVTLKELLGERIFALNEPYILGALAGVPQCFERTLTKKSGTTHYTLANYIPDVNVNGTVVGFFVLVTDVTPLKEAEMGLKLAASVYSSTENGVMITDANARILMVNPAFIRITGYTEEEVIGQKPSILKSDRQDRAFYAAMWRDIADSGRWEGELWNRRKNGEAYLEQLTITVARDEEGTTLRYVAVFKEITEIWNKDEHIRHLAFHDALTDLPNRSLLIELLSRLISMNEREKRVLAVIFLDLDGFKAVNDSLGHLGGDDVLKAVAQNILALIRKTDTVARWGGDEFIIVLDNPENQGRVAQIASLIIAAINVPIISQGKSVNIGASLGIAMFPTDGNTPADMISNADIAMYSAKNCGKNTFRFYNATMTARQR